MNWLQRLFSLRSARVQVHMAGFAPGQGYENLPFVFLNIANDGYSTVVVTRATVAATKTDKEVEVGPFEKIVIYPGDSREIVVPLSGLGLTQVFNPKNFRVHLATGETLLASLRTNVGNTGLTP